MNTIRRVAVLGAGVMGAAIAAQLANCGLDVLLLDLPPENLTPEEEAQGLTLDQPVVRNRLALAGIGKAKKARPAAFTQSGNAARIVAGNFADDLPQLKTCDWVIEAVLEHPGVKKQLLQQITPHLGDKTILSSNTSGLSINAMAKHLPEELQKRFLVTHFFNPPRYMHLLEIVPCNACDPQLARELAEFIASQLGKGVVFCKDTPNFIANRIGAFGLFNAMQHMLKLGLTVEEVDAVSGPATARPKSAIFRTADLVGLDTLVHVGRNTHQLLPDDPQRDIFLPADFLLQMVEAGLLGEKSKKGFYRKEKGKGGSQLYYFDLAAKDYVEAQKPKFASTKAGRHLDDPGARLRSVLAGDDKGAEFAWCNLRDTLLYALQTLAEIADSIEDVDKAMRWGFSWELGPFEMLDAIGVAAFADRVKTDGLAVLELLSRTKAFYRFADGRKEVYDFKSGNYVPAASHPRELKLEILRRAGSEVARNDNASLHDLGDGVFGLEFHSKMNSISPDMLELLVQAVGRAERDGVGLVLGNQGVNFSAGANLAVLGMALQQGGFEAVRGAVKAFQTASMALKYARVPVVAAPFGITLGGGCELTLHAAAITAQMETYMGLVEVGVGLLPAGGGCKESALRAIEQAQLFNTDVSPFLFKAFENIGMAKVSTSAAELFDLGYLRRGDTVVANADRLLDAAKAQVLALARGYRPPAPANGLPAPGRDVAASMKSRLWNLQNGGFISAYDAEIGATIADILCGGDVPPGTPISEAWLLELEQEGFLKLCGNEKTAQRIEHMLTTGKPLRN